MNIPVKQDYNHCKAQNILPHRVERKYQVPIGDFGQHMLTDQPWPLQQCPIVLDKKSKLDFGQRMKRKYDCGSHQLYSC